MVSTAPEATLLKPRWSAECEPTVAVDSTIVRAEHCTPFAPADPEGPAGVRVRLAALLGGLSCGTKPGEVDHFTVSLTSAKDSAEPQTVACDSAAEALFSGLTPQQQLSAYVAAFSADGTSVLAGATCEALTLPDASVDATCSQLSKLGTLRVDLKSALGQLALGCSTADVSVVTVKVPDETKPQSFPPPDCLQPFEHGFPAGTAVVQVTALRQEQGQLVERGSLVCHADVAPGRLVVAQCEPNGAE
jgi:hypothetical protein